MIRRITLLFAIAVLMGTTELYASPQIWHEVAVQARGSDSDLSYFEADDAALRDQLELAPHEALGDLSRLIQLPLPDGRLQRFEIVESPIMEPALAAKFPEFKTFKVYGVDDPIASGRVDITPRGFHGMLQTSMGRVFIDPDSTAGRPGRYLSRYRGGQPAQGFSCGIHELDFGDRAPPDLSAKAAHRIPGSLLVYRLAIAATEEYVIAVGPPVTVANAQIEIGTAINRVNEIYERDLGIRLMLVAGNDQLIEDGPNVGFSNTDPFAMLAENQAWVDSEIGSGNYDIGHVLSTGGGGLASLGSTCDNANKARGVAGSLNPVGDPFYIDFVAHEIGHQFAAEHTFNGTSLSCGGGNRNPSTAFEPGSGSTIMSYAGICGAEDLQLNSDATFHAGSIAQIDNFTGTAGSCFVQIQSNPLNNADPVINALSDVTIPRGTPFALTATASDAESGTALTYQWDQMDAGTATDAVNLGTDQGDNPLFRSYAPRNTADRDFPALGTQVQGLFDDAEVIPCQTRHLDFRLTARDGDSGQATEDVRVNVSGNAGPFRVLSQAVNTTILFSDNTFLVTWDVANTNLAPVSCANVAIDLLAFDSATYANHSVHTLLATTPNSGSAIVPAPVQWIENPARGRLRVRCTTNVFYALAEGNLQVVGDFPKTNFADNDVATFFNNNGTTGGVAPVCNAAGGFPTTGGSNNGDASSFDFAWLLLLAGLAAVRPWLRLRACSKP